MYIVFNMSFKLHVPEVGQNGCPKYAEDCAVYNIINLYICIFTCCFFSNTNGYILSEVITIFP